MLTAKEIMNATPFVVTKETPVQELAVQLFDNKLDGACVVEDGKLIGVVTAMDLVFQEKSLHLPTVITIMDAVIPLTSPSNFRKELEKLTGAHVEEIMSKEPISVGPDSKLDEVADLMVDKHITVLPVLEDGALVGTISKPDILKAAFHLNAK